MAPHRIDFGDQGDGQIRRGLGCDYFSASFWFGGLAQSRVLESMRRFAADVMPAFAHDAGAPDLRHDTLETTA